MKHFGTVLLTSVFFSACMRVRSRLEIQIASAGVEDSGRLLRYTAVLRNLSAYPIWVESCKGPIIRFQVAEGGESVGATNFVCEGEAQLLEVAGGASLRGSGVTVNYPSARYIPYVTVARAANGRGLHSVPGSVFVAPR